MEVNCETDFVARTDEFRRLARELALQVAARDPRWVAREEVPEDVIAGERKIYEEQARATGNGPRLRTQLSRSTPGTNSIT